MKINTKVIPRNGKKEEARNFDEKRIEAAIRKANETVDSTSKLKPSSIKNIAKSIANNCSTREFVTVEELQNAVEEQLYLQASIKLLQSYSFYRRQRDVAREALKNTTDENMITLLRGENTILKGENSNKNTDIAATQRDYIAGIASVDITDRLLLPKDISEAHTKGIIHFHDKDYFIQPIFNCCLSNIGDILDNGTVMNGKLIESPKSFQVACTVTTQVIACISSNQYGGQSVNMKHLGKYLRKSSVKAMKLVRETLGEDADEAVVNKMAKKMIEKELAAGIQTIQYQINTLMTTNGQSPFVTLFLHLDAEDKYLEDNALIVEEVLRQRLQGIKNEDGVYITPAFPKLVYVLDEINCLKGGKYDYITKLAAKCSSKRMYPDYISAKKMRENYEGNVFSPMGCRSFLSPWKNENGEYQFEGRFNQGVVTLNLPQIGILSKGNESLFWSLLEERSEIVKKALLERHKALLNNVRPENSPLHWKYGGLCRETNDADLSKYLKGGYSTLSFGYIGVYEMTKLVKGVSHTSQEGKDFALKVVDFMRNKCAEWKADTNIGFGLYATPAESLCYSLCEKDKKQFGEIIDVTNKGYYTNSYHVDVREEIDCFSKLLFEADFQKLSVGGCISYVEIPNLSHNVEALETIIEFIYDNTQYAEFNTKSDYCYECHFDGEIIINEHNEWECPHCGNKNRSRMSVTRRTCGYLGENFWNEGKTKEISNRVLHL